MRTKKGVAMMNISNTAHVVAEQRQKLYGDSMPLSWLKDCGAHFFVYGETRIVDSHNKKKRFRYVALYDFSQS